MSGPSAPLFALMLDAPLIGRRDRVLHAITVEGLPIKTWPEGRAVAACDGEDVGLHRVIVDGTETYAPWPPRASLPDGWERCRACMKATGSPRPRCALAVALEKETG